MHRVLIVFSALLLCFAVLAMPAMADDAYYDYATLVEAFNSAKKDTTFTLGADLEFTPDISQLFNNTTKAVLTIQGNGHSIDYIGLADGTLVLQDVHVLDKIAVSSKQKNNTTSITVGSDARVGSNYAGGISVISEAVGSIAIRNEGTVCQVATIGCAAKISFVNTGLVEGPIGVNISDQRFNDKYRLVANGDITIVNDGVIRGLTSFGVILAVQAGTDVKLTGSGIIEGPCGVAVFCQDSRAEVTISNNIRTCLADFDSDPARYAELWHILGERGVQLGLPRTTGDKTLTPEYQRSFRLAQLDLLLDLCQCGGEDVLGYAILFPQTSTKPYNGKITVTGTLSGENGLAILPDMNLFKGSIVIKSDINMEPDNRLIDIHYAQDVGSITTDKWGKKVPAMMKKIFPSGVPDSVTVRTWGIRHDETTGGLVYTTGWQGYAMDELTARQNEKGKWEVQTEALPSPDGCMDRYELGDKLSKAPDKTVMYLSSDVAVGDLDNYYNRFTFAGDNIIIDGQGNNFSYVEDGDSRSRMSPVEYIMKNGMTLRNFNILDGLTIKSGTYTKGKLLMENISELYNLRLDSVNADLKNVTSSEAFGTDIYISSSDYNAKKITVTMDENTYLLGMVSFYSGYKAGNSLTIVNDGVIDATGYAWNGSITACAKATLTITGKGRMGNPEKQDPDRDSYEVFAYDGGTVNINHNIANLTVIAGLNPYASSTATPNGTVKIAGYCRFLTVECKNNAPKCSITVTAGGIESFRILMEIADRTDPMTDKEAASYIKKNSPKLAYTKATDPNGAKVVPTYRITGADSTVLWEGQIK